MKKKKGLILIGSLLLFIGMVTAFIMYQNSYDFKEEKIMIPTSDGELEAVMTMPKNHQGPLKVVLFIHGDGPQEASYDGFYKPIWETLSKQGYATLSWSKKGVGKSTGDWLDQSMEDRADEAVEVIDWLKTASSFETKEIALWGASQAGWVVPKIVAKREIAFSILVSPAINWLQQGDYNGEQEMTAQGFSNEEKEAAKVHKTDLIKLMQEDASYEEYLKIAKEGDGFTKERWAFVKKNVNADATDDLKNFHSPVLLVIGGADKNVDVEDTKRVYQQQIDEKLLSITYLPNADHSMVKKDIAASEFKLTLTGILAPKQLFDEGYSQGVIDFLNNNSFSGK